MAIIWALAWLAISGVTMAIAFIVAAADELINHRNTIGALFAAALAGAFGSGSFILIFAIIKLWTSL